MMVKINNFSNSKETHRKKISYKSGLSNVQMYWIIFLSVLARGNDAYDNERHEERTAIHKLI